MFQDRLQKVRESHGYSVKEAATALGLPYTTYNNYEKNMREPSGEVLCQIASFFSVSLDYLFGLTTTGQETGISNEMRSICDKMEALDTYGKRLVSLVLDEEYHRCLLQQEEQLDIEEP
jgi:transcriptional regulator with XRE-family HTH domain